MKPKQSLEGRASISVNPPTLLHVTIPPQRPASQRQSPLDPLSVHVWPVTADVGLECALHYRSPTQIPLVVLDDVRR